MIPVQNMADRIHHCLNSIVGQMTNDIETIVVNDGSIDDTCKVVSEFTSKDPRIRLYQNKGTGVSSARNVGIEAAKGKYLLFVDADDDIEHGYLLDIVNHANAFDADILVWGIKRCFSDGRIEEWRPEMNGVYDRKVFLTSFPSEQYGRHEGLYGFISNKMVKKEIVDLYELRFNTTMNLMEDYDFFLSCYEHCRSFLLFSETGYRYYISDIIRQTGKRKIISYPQLIEVHIKCADLLKREDAMTPENEILLKHAIANLSLSMFLETREDYYTQVKSHMDFIWENTYCIPALRILDTRWKFLRFMILKRNVTGAFLYVRLWRSYLFFRTGVKS